MSAYFRFWSYVIFVMQSLSPIVYRLLSILADMSLIPYPSVDFLPVALWQTMRILEALDQGKSTDTLIFLLREECCDKWPQQLRSCCIFWLSEFRELQFRTLVNTINQIVQLLLFSRKMFSHHLRVLWKICPHHNIFLSIKVIQMKTMVLESWLSSTP